MAGSNRAPLAALVSALSSESYLGNGQLKLQRTILLNTSHASEPHGGLFLLGSDLSKNNHEFTYK